MKRIPYFAFAAAIAVGVVLFTANKVHLVIAGALVIGALIERFMFLEHEAQDARRLEARALEEAKRELKAIFNGTMDQQAFALQKATETVNKQTEGLVLLEKRVHALESATRLRGVFAGKVAPP